MAVVEKVEIVEARATATHSQSAGEYSAEDVHASAAVSAVMSDSDNTAVPVQTAAAAADSADTAAHTHSADNSAAHTVSPAPAVASPSPRHTPPLQRCAARCGSGMVLGVSAISARGCWAVLGGRSCRFRA